MNKAKINGNPYEYASSWNELTKKHALYFMNLYLLKLSADEIKIRLMFYMLGFRMRKKHSVIKDGEEFFLVRTDKGDIYFPADQLAFLASGLDFLFITNDKDQEFVNSELSINLLPEFEHNKVTYYGPADRLFNLSWSEFTHANVNLHYYNSTKEVEYLDKLIACIYRRKQENNDPGNYKYTGDPREPFNDFLIDHYAEIFSSIPLNYKHLIYLYYLGSLKEMRANHPQAFGGSGGGDPSMEEILSMIDLLAKNDLTKTDDIEKKNVFKVLINIKESKQKQTQNPK